jgi:type IV secretory pathway VirB2 component (pilin)
MNPAVLETIAIGEDTCLTVGDLDFLLRSIVNAMMGHVYNIAGIVAVICFGIGVLAGYYYHKRKGVDGL